MRLQIQLQCGHKLIADNPDKAYHWCQACGYLVHIYAAECREWKATCNSCSYSRWFGQDKHGSVIAVTKHMRSKGHGMTLDFLQNTKKKDFIIDAYGPRGCRRVIIGEPHLTQKGIQQKKVYPDDPPF
jgi:hypothetical protein